nr:3-hydroxyisobutyryl-CoA hydrolase 1-like [Tanacetum cinerariifolium]
MAQENYVDGCSMQRPPSLEPNGFCFWKARFETYVKNEVEDPETKLMKETPYELHRDEKKKQLGKNNEANITLYNAIPWSNRWLLLDRWFQVLVKESSNARTIVLNRPKQLNALSGEVVSSLLNTLVYLMILVMWDELVIIMSKTVEFMYIVSY